VKNKIGVMEGRLLPKYQGRYQAHPLGYWQDEFSVAQEIGLNCIEFILDFNDANQNPLLKEGGIADIQQVIDQTGVEVVSICADYFMEAPLHATDIEQAAVSQLVLIKLLNNAKKLGVKDVVIPCVDQATLDGDEAASRFVKMLMPVVDIADGLDINLSLETDLAPQPFTILLDRFNSGRVTVNYDLGNSAALGYDPVEELDAYGNKITDIHLKDRVRNGGPVVLGEGDVDFDSFFNKLVEFNYQGPFIMQAYRDEEGIAIFKSQLEWVSKYLK